MRLFGFNVVGRKGVLCNKKGHLLNTLRSVSLTSQPVPPLRVLSSPSLPTATSCNVIPRFCSSSLSINAARWSSRPFNPSHPLPPLLRQCNRAYSTIKTTYPRPITREYIESNPSAHDIVDLINLDESLDLKGKFIEFTTIINYLNRFKGHLTAREGQLLAAAHVYRAKVTAVLGKVNEALNELHYVESHFDTDDPRLNFETGLIYRSVFKFSTAIRYLTKSINFLDSGNPLAFAATEARASSYYSLYEILEEQKPGSQEAKDYFLKAATDAEELLLHSEEPAAYLLRGKIYIRTNPQKAEKDLLTAANTTDNTVKADAYFFLTYLHLLHPNLTSTYKYFEKFKEIEPYNSPRLIEIEKAINTIQSRNIDLLMEKIQSTKAENLDDLAMKDVVKLMERVKDNKSPEDIRKDIASSLSMLKNLKTEK